MTKQKRLMNSVGEIFIVAVIILVLVILLLPEDQVVDNSSNRERFRNQLRLVGLACHEYQSEYGCLPPVVISDERGRPIHSWRAMLLPWLESQGRTQPPAYVYTFNEPWFSPANRQAALDNANLYTMLVSTDDREVVQKSKLAAVIGAQTYWSPSGECRRLPLEANQDERHILLLEIPNLYGAWSQPNDVTLDVVLTLSKNQQFEPDGAHVLYDDGSVTWFAPEALTEANLRRLLCPFDTTK
ncbi:DUF1559 domain-containing protein [Gimesia benthica]|uniref:DUF1559 domain-containing protein n=1 Tax=Gimesia benthica TaxID=2608982 RepID=A0A6I6AG25_9PLAN|nr:DUF1559 domain-containing protein [Gimesia benthica]QGQ25228.1 DUF1559 domain-containing protein [Gimesia benthica]